MVVDEADLADALFQRFQDTLAPPDPHTEFDGRKALAKRQDLLRQVGVGHAVDRRDGHAARFQLPQVGHFPADQVDLAEDRGKMLRRQRARLCQLDAVGAPVEQGLPELPFELRDLAADGRGRHMEPIRSQADRSQMHDFEEIAAGG